MKRGLIFGSVVFLIAGITLAGNSLEVTAQSDLDPGTGYYPPPYSYSQCLTVFTKEMCDFRFNDG
ncbi:MAG TPA: hypothetical protein VIP29_02695 [Nitrososphaeraceae archaeon]